MKTRNGDWLKKTRRWDNEAGNKIKMLRDWMQAAKAKFCASILKGSKECTKKFAHTKVFFLTAKSHG
jgi:hypothetical protein